MNPGLADPSPPRRTYRARRLQERVRRRERAVARVRNRVDLAAVPDPLLRQRDSRRRAGLAWLAGSLAIHFVVAALAVVLPARAPDRREAPLQVEIVDVRPPPPPPPEPAPPAPTPPPQPRVVPPPPKVVLRAPPTPQVAPPEPKPTPPPDPVDVKPPPPTPPPEVQRVVGLSLDSTDDSSEGPSFAVGNTRMGETGKVASAPSDVHPLSDQFVAPRRTMAPEPTYPPDLAGRGMEGEVGLEVQIDALGKVGAVDVIKPSAEESFNRAAVDSAQQSTYEPALSNGIPVAYAIRFTVRFRLKKGMVTR